MLLSDLQDKSAVTPPGEAKPRQARCWTRPGLQVGRSVARLALAARRRRSAVARCPAGASAASQGATEAEARLAPRALPGNRGQVASRVAAAGPGGKVATPSDPTPEPVAGDGGSRERPECLSARSALRAGGPG